MDDPRDIDLAAIDPLSIVGITSGASAPEDLVEKLLTRLAERFRFTINTVDHIREDVVFKQPLMLAS